MSGSKKDSNKGLVTDLSQMGISEMFPEARLLCVIENITESFLITWDDVEFLETTQRKIHSSFLGVNPSYSRNYTAWDFSRDFVGFVEYISSLVEPGLTKDDEFVFMCKKDSDEAKNLTSWCNYICECLKHAAQPALETNKESNIFSKSDTSFFEYDKNNKLTIKRPNARFAKSYRPQKGAQDLIDFLYFQPRTNINGHIKYEKVPVLRYLTRSKKVPYEFTLNKVNPTYAKAVADLMSQIREINRGLERRDISLRIKFEEGHFILDNDKRKKLKNNCEYIWLEDFTKK